MKKFLTFVGAFCVLSLPVFADDFSDVDENHQNYAAIEYLAEHDVVNGYEDGTYKPENLVNRAEAIRMIMGAFREMAEAEHTEVFPDVGVGDWFFPFVMAAVDAEILDGYDDGTYKPAQTVNLAEVLKMVALATEVELSDVEFDVFVDVKSDAWFAPYALYSRDHNVILADMYGRANVGQDITRGAISEIIYRMMVIVKDGERVFPLQTNWPYYHSTKLPFQMKYDDETWQVIEHKDETIFWYANEYYNQFSPTRVYPNSAKVVVTLDGNKDGLSKNVYFENIKEIFPGAKYAEFTVGGLDAIEVLYSEQRVVDWYVYLADGRVLAVYTEYGAGALGFQLPQFIGAMLSTLHYQDPDEAPLEVMSTIFANVLVEGQGMNMIKLLPDRVIIETDTIGVGTGPVDYYYSETLDYTLKYERQSNVILATKKGQTSAF